MCSVVISYAVFIDMLCYQKVRVGCRSLTHQCIIWRYYINVWCYLERKLGIDKFKKKKMITSLVLLVLLLAGPVVFGATTSGSPTEKLYAGIINAFYGTNHTGRPVECGRDWTYYHYLATQMLIQIVLTIGHIMLTVFVFVKLWRKGKSSLRV